MTAKLQSKVLVLAVLGTIGTAYATEELRLPPRDSTQITNSLSNTYINYDANYSVTGYLQGIAVFDVFDPGAESMAVARVNDIQKNLHNKLEVSDPSRATVDDSVKDVKGNVGVNNASGFFNQQANNVAVASVNGKKSAALASVSFEQLNQNNSYDFGRTRYGTSNDMTADIKNSVKDIDGNVGLNNAAGAGNQQKNDVALASASYGVLASASAGGMQINQNTTVTSSLPLVTTATISNSIKNISGNAGVNNAAGLGNQQVNTLSIAAISK